MDILQTIWIALTTPNERLIKTSFMFLTCLEIGACAYFFTNILNINTTKKQFCIYVLIHGVCAAFITCIVPTSYTVFANMIIWPILVFFILKTTILKSILSEIITLVVTSILDFILANLFLALFQITSEQIMTIPIYRYTAMFSTYTVLVLLTFSIKYFKINIPIIDNMDKKNKILLIVNALLIVIVLAMQFYLVRFYSNVMPAFITFISIIGLIAYFNVSIYSMISISKLKTTERELEGAQLTIHSLTILHDTVRSFKHDFDNIVNGIGGYIRDKDMQGLEAYYKQILEECKKTINLYYLRPELVNEPSIYNILASKYYIADKQKIEINLDVFLDLREIENHMKIYEFTRILGILLDNAIEAAKECEEKIINVSFRKDEHNQKIVVKIENTYKNKDVDIKKIFNKDYSSKEEHSGLGLWKIKQILNKNNTLNLLTSKNDMFFQQQFEIYY